MKQFIILFFMLLFIGVVKVSAQYGCELPESDCTENWSNPPLLGVVYNALLPSNTVNPCFADIGIRYERRCNEFRIIEVFLENKPDCYDEAYDNNPVGNSDANLINHAIQGLLKYFFATEHSSSGSDYHCPPWGSNTVSYSASFASCFKEVWTVTWYTTNPLGGPPIKHTHDFEILKSNLYNEDGTYKDYYLTQVTLYMNSQGVYQLPGYPKPWTVASRYIPCSDYCCILEYNFCYNPYTDPISVEMTLTNYIPSNQSCPQFDNECYIQTCQ